MNSFSTITSIALCLIICLAATLVRAGGDKSAKTTVITLAGGGDKHQGGYPIPIPIPVCTGSKMHGGFGSAFGGHGGGGGGYGHGGGHSHYGAQARMGWRR